MHCTLHLPLLSYTPVWIIRPSEGRCEKVTDAASWPGSWCHRFVQGKSLASHWFLGGWANPSQKKNAGQIGFNFPMDRNQNNFWNPNRWGCRPFCVDRNSKNARCNKHIQMLCLESCYLLLYVMPCPSIHAWEYIAILVPISRWGWRIPKERPLPSE